MGLRLPNAHALVIERLDNLGGQDRLELPDIGISMPEIAVNITAISAHFERFVFHCNISFSLFNRSLIRSISETGTDLFSSQNILVQRLVAGAETARNNLVESLPVLPHHRHRDLRGLFFRITVRAGADGGKGNRLHTVLEREFERVAVATCEQGRLVRFTAVPNGADGVDDVLRGEFEAGGNLGLAGRTAA